MNKPKYIQFCFSNHEDTKTEIIISKKIIKSDGLCVAVFYMFLLEEWNHCIKYNKNKILDPFLLAVSNEYIKDSLGFSDSRISYCKKRLKKLGLISTRIMGSDSIEYYEINRQGRKSI
jgi:hypothetical protein